MTELVRCPWREASEYHRSGTWSEDTVADLLEAWASGAPGAPGYIIGDSVITRGAVRDRTAQLAVDLLALGCGPGDVVVLVMRDGPEHVAAMIAPQSIGAVAAPMAFTAGPGEIAAIVADYRARVVVTDVDTELGPFDVDHEVTVLRPGPLETWPSGEGASLPPEGCRPDADAVSEVMFTSGTTGRPKGVMNSANTKLTGLRGLLECFPLGADDVWGVIPPMSHNAGWLYTVLVALGSGAPLVGVGRGNPERMLDELERHRVTATFLVPTHMSDLLACYRRHPGRWSLSLRYVVTGSGPSQEAVITGAAADWGVTTISMYGMTECQGNLFTRPDDPIDVIATTAGRPCPGSEVGLRDPATGAMIHEDGETGEVVTRGATTFLGYYDDEAATAACFTADGWFRSGDLGQWVNGAMRIVGRVKEVILRGGATVSPEEVELAFADVPGIGDVAAVGLPDERLGERVCLVVTGESPSRAALQEHLRARGLGRHLVPDDVRRVAEFPRTPLGKVRRSQLTSLLTVE